jgi:hypothetical protein
MDGRSTASAKCSGSRGQRRRSAFDPPATGTATNALGCRCFSCGADLGDWAPRRTRRWKLAELRTPVEQREWLSLSEAARHLRSSRRTIHGWNEAGLLPNTREPAKGSRLYLRADLDRVRHAPRRGAKQIDRKALLARIRGSSVGQGYR